MDIPISERCSFREFINAIKDLPPKEINDAAQAEHRYVERCCAPHVHGAPKARKEMGTYGKDVHDFLYFLTQGGARPYGVFDPTFLLYKPIADKLVTLGVWPVSVLEQFQKSSDGSFADPWK